MPGGGNPFHYHTTYTETFTALEGELGLYAGKKQRIVLKPGETYTVQPKQLHRFFNPGNTENKFKVTLNPGMKEWKMHLGFYMEWQQTD